MHSKKGLFSRTFTALQSYGLLDLVQIFKARMFGKPINIDSMIELLSKSSEILLQNKSFVILTDLETITCIYVTPGFQSITGYSTDAYLQGGSNFFFNNYCPADWTEGIRIWNLIIEHQKDKDISDKDQYLYTSTFRFLTANGYYKWLFNRMIFMRHDENNRPTLLFSLLTDVDSFKRNETLSYSRNRYHPVTSIYETEIYEEFTPDGIDILSETDLQMLNHLSNGLNNHEIAEAMGFSEHTIKDYRKKMLQKTWCSNTSELLCFVLRNNLLGSGKTNGLSGHA